jgi:hypothetical protein
VKREGVEFDGRELTFADKPDVLVERERLDLERGPVRHDDM